MPSILSFYLGIEMLREWIFFDAYVIYAKIMSEIWNRWIVK